VKRQIGSYDPRMRPAAAALTAGDVLTLPELQQLRRISGLRGMGLVLHAWSVIAAGMLLYALWPSAVTLVLAIVLVGARQLGLLVLMHEGAHWRLVPNAPLNNAVAQWLCAHPVGAELVAYRRQHHLHHRHTRQADDPDRALAIDRPISPAVFWRDVLCDLAGVTACARTLGGRPGGTSAAQLWRRWRGPLAANAVLFGVLAGLGQWPLYLLLWLLPLATWHQLAVRMRNLAEHGLVADGEDPLRNTRTVRAGPLARAFVAPYWVNYHLEHHLFVFAPCWKLRRAHAILLARGLGARMETASGYLDVIRRATSPR
jgi:fatty acid desaturase